MAHVRKLLLTLASGSALYSGLVPALGLGGITLHSALNQPLEADIELLQMGDLDSGDIRVRLASEADFARTGVDRLFFLNDLRFTPLLRGNRHIIRVVSSKPVQEPYLNFVIEVARPNGQLLREYTVLLDPPSSSAYSAVAAAPVAEQPRASAARSAPVAVADLPPATQGRTRLSPAWAWAARRASCRSRRPRGCAGRSCFPLTGGHARDHRRKLFVIGPIGGDPLARRFAHRPRCHAIGGEAAEGGGDRRRVRRIAGERIARDQRRFVRLHRPEPIR